MTSRARHRHLALIAVFTSPVQQDRTAIMRRIADAVGVTERQFQRAVGAEWEAAYRADWATRDEAFDMLHEPDRGDVLPRFKIIENKVA